jgi:hypothetical protein
MAPAKSLLANFVNESVIVATGGTGIQVTESGLVMIPRLGCPCCPFVLFIGRTELQGSTSAGTGG